MAAQKITDDAELLLVQDDLAKANADLTVALEANATAAEQEA